MSTLPSPSPEAAAHSAHLVDLIRQEIMQAGGGIGFARFMEMALYQPGLGYYSAGATKFGPGGDFITAPEVSPLFAQCLASPCQRVLQGLGGGDILEFGAGSGRLAQELLLELERHDAMPQRYLILEPSADLKARQRNNLQQSAPHLMDRIHWLDALPQAGFAGLVLANEVLDAMPVHRFCKEQGNLYEIQVGWNGAEFCWIADVPGAELVSVVQHIEAGLGASLPSPYISEVNLLLEPWVASLAERLRQGIVVLIDYGYPRRAYYHPERRMGTLMCHYRQRAHPNPLILVGLQDITAFVDFTAVAEAGIAHGLSVTGFTTQAHFLIACGLDQHLSEIRTREPGQYLKYAQQAKTLTLPGEMGERFKAMALAKGWEGPLPGFELFDQRGRL